MKHTDRRRHNPGRASFLNLGRANGSKAIVLRYKREWERLKYATDPEYAERQRENRRAYRKTERGAATSRRRCLRWRAIPENRDRLNMLWRKRNAERRRCFGCHRLPRRYERMRRIERLVDVGGKLEQRRVWWCGSC
jgi:hypothetical protein